MARLITMRRRTHVLNLGGTLLALITSACAASASPHAALGSTPHSPTAGSSAGHGVPVPLCRAVNLQLSVARTGAVMSQPFADIAVANEGATPCAISGYPRVWVRGYSDERQRGVALPQAISVRHGLYERIDAGPVRVVVRPDHRAYFSIGTATAYGGGRHLISLTRLTVTLPGTKGRLTLPIDLAASREPGQAIPVGITALTRSPRA